MNRTVLLRLGLLVIVGVLLAGAWQVAYARGKDDGTREATTIRNEFLQARAGGGTAAGPATDGAAGQAGQAGQGGQGGQGRAKPGGGQAGPGGQGGQFGPPAANGTIEKIDGTALSVATSDGVVKVNLGERTQIRKQVTVAASELKAGDRIVVIGERTGEREVTANAIQIQGQ